MPSVLPGGKLPEGRQTSKTVYVSSGGFILEKSVWKILFRNVFRLNYPDPVARFHLPTQVSLKAVLWSICLGVKLLGQNTSILDIAKLLLKGIGPDFTPIIYV